MKRFILASCVMIVLVVVAHANTPPEIRNVRVVQRAGTKLVDIYYDAYDADNDSLLVRIQISSNDGKTYYLSTSSMTGDVGLGIAPGDGKHAVWNAGEDWDGEYSETMRVRIGVTDMKHCYPPMEFGDEVMPGGFLMGYDETSAEGSGPSKRVVIPWNYRLGKFEVTEVQYCDFLNWALAAGFIEYKNGEIVSTSTMPWTRISAGTKLSLGGSSWRVNSFYTTTTNLPANVNWYSALVFARFYGYDLPTEAEWELAARGPEHDDLGEHEVYPWGDVANPVYANFNYSSQKVVGSYSNAYEAVNGLHDIIGNVYEWTRTQGEDITRYSSIDSLTNVENRILNTSRHIVRGGTLAERSSRDTISAYNVGFRVCLRPSDVIDEDISGTGTGR